ncbi:hypothetical protein [Bacillus sp. T33-2]|uniref:hypothetical protein n=1 Tax=Bacillus sp. T33-2 TaxID=2054168 RepID=UPI000C758F22|nr:hypothetical protein [Bacillus sp. T33-2]PLR99641.1 hypothetical protein CVD19_00850 [Bacillus sp. T33-2]
MARGRKPNSSVDENIVEEKVVDEQTVKVEQEKSKPQKKKQIERDALIACFNVTSGRLTYISRKSGLQTVWSNYGDVEYLEFAELLTMKSSQPKFLNEPWIFVEDEEVVNQLGLKEVYKNIIPLNEVDEFFALDVNKAKEILPKLPRGMKDLIGDQARKAIQSGDLYNIQLVRLLEQELQLDLISLMD